MSQIANAWHHSVSSARKWGGRPEDYLAIHQWFDESKEHLADFRHRALRHHTQGIFECERQFGPTIEISAGIQHTPETCPGRPCGDGCDHFQPKKIPTRWVGEQHVKEDLGRIPTVADWFMLITPERWMNNSRKLSLEQEGDP